MTSKGTFCLICIAVLLAVAQAVPVRAEQYRNTRQRRDVDDGRLPRRIIPRHYNLELVPDIYSTSGPPFTFSGTVEIYVTCLQTANYVVLNAKDLEYTAVAIVADLNSPVGTPSPILLDWSYDPNAEFLSLDTVNQLVPGAYYIIRATFHGVMRSDGNGLYWDSYIDTDGSTKYIAATQLESIEARKVFPCFDEPDLKATFNITIVSKPPSVTLSNMPLVSTKVWSDGLVAYSFATSPVMSTYQVCTVVGDFIYVEAEWQGVTTYPVRIYARPQMAGKLAFAARAAPLIQPWLEQETGIPYPLPKMDHIALPNKNGAMENWGLITYVESLLCVDPQTSAASGIFDVASLISHELAHQWYGNLVTAKWWDDIWLNEGFATFYNYYPQAALGWEGSESQQSDGRRGTQQFLDVDQLNTSDPIRKTVNNVWQADAAFSGSTYPKGGAMLRMLQSILSPSTFKKGLTNYLTKYSYSSAVSDDLWTELSAQAAADGIKHPDGSALDVKTIMDAWLNQMGYPVLSVVRNGDGTATVTSRRFLSPRGQSPDTPSNYSYSWHVPITVATPQAIDLDATPSFYLPFGQSTLTITGVPTTPGDWILINIKQNGFYRVDYDSFLRNDITAQLNNDYAVIPVESRAQLIDDSFTLTRSLNLPVSFAMDTTLYLTNERLYNPWRAALKHLLYIEALVFNELWHNFYETYIFNQLEPVYNNLGWNYLESESPLQQFIRRDAILYMCYFGNDDCRNTARSQYATYIANPDVNSINANNLPTVLCTGISEGTGSDWSIAFNQYLNRKLSPIREERYVYLFGMACSADSQWHDRLLSYITQGTLISTRDANTALFYMTQSRVGLPVVWNYLLNSWSSVPSFINKLSALQSIAEKLSDSSALDEFYRFVASYPPQSQAQVNAFNRIELTIKQNVDFLTANRDGLFNWLDTNLPLAAKKTNQKATQSPLPVSPAAYWDWLSPSDIGY
jgi:aminopeptidase N